MSRRVFLKVEVTIAADVDDEVTDMEDLAAYILGQRDTVPVLDGAVWNEDVQLGEVTVEDAK